MAHQGYFCAQVVIFFAKLGGFDAKGGALLVVGFWLLVFGC